MHVYFCDSSPYFWGAHTNQRPGRRKAICMYTRTYPIGGKTWRVGEDGAWGVWRRLSGWRGGNSKGTESGRKSFGWHKDTLRSHHCHHQCKSLDFQKWFLLFIFVCLSVCFAFYWGRERRCEHWRTVQRAQASQQKRVLPGRPGDRESEAQGVWLTKPSATCRHFL